MNKFSINLTLAALLTLSLSVVSLADTIRLKNGSVIRGQVIGFRDQQFTVLVGSGSRGRQSRITLYMEDVESVEFDSAVGAASLNTNDDSAATDPVTQPTAPASSQSNTAPDDRASSSTTRPTTNQSSSQTSQNFFQVNTRVRGDNTTNGWTNSGLVVRRGQRLRITATGRITLGAGRISTPAGLPTIPDRDKLMRTEPTGALIAVIGDDNDDFIVIGRNREFVAQRDGVLFLGVNEGNLGDNSGAYDAVIEAEAVGGTTR